MFSRITVARQSLRSVVIPTKPKYRELDPETRKLYQKFIRVDHAGERYELQGVRRIVRKFVALKP
jgi:hypothetical protein